MDLIQCTVCNVASSEAFNANSMSKWSQNKTCSGEYKVIENCCFYKSCSVVPAEGAAVGALAGAADGDGMEQNLGEAASSENHKSLGNPPNDFLKPSY